MTSPTSDPLCDEISRRADHLLDTQSEFFDGAWTWNGPEGLSAIQYKNGHVEVGFHYPEFGACFTKQRNGAFSARESIHGIAEARRALELMARCMVLDDLADI